jgi:hypothetical protein
MHVDSLSISPVSKHPTVQCHGLLCLRCSLLQKILGKGVRISVKWSLAPKKKVEKLICDWMMVVRSFN